MNRNSYSASLVLETAVPIQKILYCTAFKAHGKMQVTLKERETSSIFSPVTTEVRHGFFKYTVKLSWVYNCVPVIYIPKAGQHLRESWHRKTGSDEKDENLRRREQQERGKYLPWAEPPLWRTSHPDRTWGGCSPWGYVCETNIGLLRSGNTILETK